MPVLIAIFGWIGRSWLGKLIVETLIGRLVEWAKSQIELARKKRELKRAADESVKPLKEAVTADEIDKASDSALDGF